MRWVEIRRNQDGGKWKVGISHERPDQSTEVTQEGVVDTRAVSTIARLVESVSDPLWRLEIGKRATRYPPELLAVALLLADAAMVSEGEKEVRLAMRVNDAAAVAHIVAIELARSGAGVRGVVGLRVAACLRLLIALPTAFAIHLGLLIRHWKPARQLKVDGRLVFAIHGELSNRTRHLLPPRFDPGRRPVFVILGRPRASIDKVARTIDPGGRMPDMILVRPAGLVAAVSSLPHALQRVGAGFRVLRDIPAAISLRDCVAMAFRLFYGACQAAWWRRAGLTPEVVAFGHTGVADTTALEEAMQKGGCRTVHCVHGLSLGWNYVGHSDVGLFTCGHDAELARRLGSYRKATSVPCPMPAPLLGDERWLVMTAYSHPMNLAYASSDIAPDQAVLEAVAEAARLSGQKPSNVFWRPHPAIGRIDAEDRTALQAAAADLGFTAWPEDLPYKEAARFGVVMTTPSTAAIDMLRLGKLPVIVVTAPLQADTVYDSFPLVVRTRRELGAVLSRFEAAAKIQAEFRATWDTIRPGGYLTTETILGAGEGLAKPKARPEQSAGSSREILR